MIIEIQNNFLPEKKYILGVLFNHYLGLEFQIRLSESANFSIILDNGRKLVFPDLFFTFSKDVDSLYQLKNLPEEVHLIKNEFAPESDLVALYGSDEFNKDKNITCGFDLVSSAFFMLTRWEEMISVKKDKHDRFPDEEALAVKFGFYHRPIVNEYVEFIWNALCYLGFEGNRKPHVFEPIITHDIDEMWRYATISRFLRAMAGDLIQRKSLTSLFATIKDFMQIHFQKKPDNYDTFQLLMQLSEEHHLKSRFYFIPGEIGETDVRYNIHHSRVNDVIHEIVMRGHEVGIHTSYDSYDDFKKFSQEVDRIKQICSEIKGGRQHYLRLKIPDTFRYWEKEGLKYDSTLGFAFDAGFRAGTCFSFPIFDLVKRKQLQLLEKPVTVMEVALRKKYNHPGDFLENMNHFIDVVKKYRGEFVLIWHNSSFNTWEWNDNWLSIYKQTVQKLSER